MPISDALIRSRASAASFKKGQDYFSQGVVVELQQRGETLFARVEGSNYEPYEVTIELSDGELVKAECNCPFDRNGDCKHIVAVLLSYLHQPDRITKRPSVADLLADFGREELVALLTGLLAKQPRLIELFEAEVACKRTSAQPASPHRQRQTQLDPSVFRQQARLLMRHHDSSDYHAAQEIASGIQELLEKARPFLEGGDGRNALLILEAITEPFVAQWYEFDDSDGELGGVFEKLGPLFAEAILSTELSAAERKAWVKKLNGWQDDIEDYGIDEGFQVAVAAAEEGWDDPVLKRVLQGDIPGEGVREEDETRWYDADLAAVRLNVLERQGRTAEFLFLAEAEGQTTRYLTMLVKLGRVQEAMDRVMQYSTAADEVLAVAQTLSDHDHPVEALKIAEHGLTFSEGALALARWLRDFATQRHQPETALKAARVAFLHSFHLEDYIAVEAAAGTAWPLVKAEMLDRLATTPSAYDAIAIYLHEGLIDQAIETVDKRSYVGYSDLERVVDSALSSHPDWAIRQCRRQAEEIMDAGRSQAYHHAIRWLEKARQAFLGANRAAEWQTYLDSQISKHVRKYSLRPQLEKLRKA